MRAREVNRKVLRAGGYQVRQVGSHRRFAVGYTRPDGSSGTVMTTVPQHPGDLPGGTLAAIERDLAPALGKGGCSDHVPGRGDS
ncbi:MAG TPA: type II toxin-antitoxin system HicA family toxin [Kribbellaceae bacterium]|nr:type II toxin-antitoxin system HicA family toxin [Kribbellaceae bacterium]